MAFVTLYVAWFVYEDEERGLQNRLDDWWIQFDDLRKSVVSRQAAFAVVVARKSREALLRVFGPRADSDRFHA
jgi:hypothetical protein